MSKNSKKNTKDKLNALPPVTGSFGSSTDSNLTSSSGADGDDSHDLFIHLKSDKKNV